MTDGAAGDAPLPWHEDTWARFVSALDEDRVGHALLIQGPAGTGKQRLADRMVAALVCAAERPNHRPCGVCGGCRLRRAGTHPDLRRVIPGEEGKPIGIGAIRDLCSGLLLTSTGTGVRVGVIESADRLTRPAANALLKTLEEPPPGVVLILVTDHPARLPATIRSRCQQVRVGLPAAGQALAWLAGRTSGDPGRWLALAGGRPLEAVSLAGTAAADHARALFEGLEAVVAGRRAAGEVARSWDKDDAEAWRWLATFAVDLLRLKCHGRAPMLMHRELESGLVKLAQRFPAKALFERLDEALAGIRGAQTSLNARLQLEAALIGWIP